MITLYMRLGYYFILLFMAMNFCALAQQSESISFSETTFDFGTVQEENGSIIHEFWFKNNGEEPITIINVKASCGCTTPAWSKEPVAPGESGFIQAQYNTTNRPGVFNKNLKVTTNLNQPIILYIKGQVEPKVKSAEEKLTAEMGAIRMKYTSLNLGKVYINKESTSHKFEIYNQSEGEVKFLDKYDAPDHIKLEFEPRSISPDSYGILVIKYDAQLKNDFGFMNDNVVFYTDEKEESMKSINVYATIQEYFEPMTKAELENAPMLKIEKDVYDFGRVKSEHQVETIFVLKNMGKNELLIRKISPNCACVTGKTDKQKIKPGEEARLVVTFNSESRKGNQQKSITIYSNDPATTAQRITLKAYVED